MDLSRIRWPSQTNLTENDVTPNLALAMKEDTRLEKKLNKIRFTAIYDDQVKPRKRLGIIHELIGGTIFPACLLESLWCFCVNA